MEPLVLIVGLFVLAMWLGPLVTSIVLWGSLRRRLRQLEARLQALTGPVVGGASADAPVARATEPEPVVGEPDQTPAAASVDASPELPSEASPESPVSPGLAFPGIERLVVWAAAGLGGLLAVVAALLALAVAIDRGWLGPSVRVSVALITGTALWWAGRRSRGSGHRTAASALEGAGIGTLYGGLYAASELYMLVSPSLGGLAMVAVTGVSAARAVVVGDRFLAWLSLVGGLLTPILVSSGESSPYTLFGYLGLLAAGFVAVALRRAWIDVLVGAAVGVGALHIMWTVTWYAPSGSLPALLGVGWLMLPFAVAAARREGPLRWAALACAVGVAVLAAPWVVPIDPWFLDPRTGERVARSAGDTQGIAAVAACLLPLPLVLADRRAARASGLAAGLVATVLAVATAAGWARSPEVSDVWLAVGAAGPALLGVALLVRASGGRGYAVALLGAGVALLLAQGAMTGPPWGLALGALAAAGAGLAAVTGWGGAAAAGTLALATPMIAVDPQVMGVMYVTGVACAGLALASHAPVLVRWRADARWAWLAAAVVNVAMFVPLYRSWHVALGAAGTGVLALLLGANALLAASTLLRRGALVRREVVTAVFVAVVLLGAVAAVPLELHQRWLTVVWALEAVALAWAYRRLEHPLLQWGSLLLCGFVGVRLVLNPWSLSWGTAAEGLPILNWTLYSWGVPFVCVLVVARWLPRFALPLGGLAALIGFALVNVQVSHAFQDAGPLELGGYGRVQGMVRSGSWAAWGLGVLGVGLWRDERWVRLVGFAFVLLATCKVFVYDLWGLSGFVRVGSVACLAVSLLLAALLFERVVLRGVGRGDLEEAE